MVSYNIGDPSFRSATSESTKNLFGSFGSHIADPLHLSLGISYLLLIFIISGFHQVFYRIISHNKKTTNKTQQQTHNRRRFAQKNRPHP